jgi:hypothetical protein
MFFLSLHRVIEIVKGTAKDAVEQMGNESSQKLSLVYGEIDFFSFANILDRAAPKQGDTFVDLGHGTGKGIICAALMYGPLLKECYGMEIIPELNTISVNTAQRFRDEILTQPLFENHRNCTITVEEGDLLAEEYSRWTDAGNAYIVVYSVYTCKHICIHIYIHSCIHTYICRDRLSCY